MKLWPNKPYCWKIKHMHSNLISQYLAGFAWHTIQFIYSLFCTFIFYMDTDLCVYVAYIFIWVLLLFYVIVNTNMNLKQAIPFYTWKFFLQFLEQFNFTLPSHFHVIRIVWSHVVFSLVILCISVLLRTVCWFFLLYVLLQLHKNFQFGFILWILFICYNVSISWWYKTFHYWANTNVMLLWITIWKTDFFSVNVFSLNLPVSKRNIISFNSFGCLAQDVFSGSGLYTSPGSHQCLRAQPLWGQHISSLEKLLVNYSLCSEGGCCSSEYLTWDQWIPE